MSKKILIMRTHAMGDIVHTTIIPYAIKKTHPDYELHYIIKREYLDLLKDCSYIDKIIEYNEENFFANIDVLKKEHYDIIFCLNFTQKSLLLSYLSFPKKIVFKGKNDTSWVENYFLTAKNVIKDIELPQGLHLETNKHTDNKISEKLNKFPRPYFIFSPGRQYFQPRQGRVWNIEKWKKLSKEMLNKYGGTIFIIGSLKEKEYHESLKDKNIQILSGELDIAESMSVLSKADLVISGDTGPIHIASALGTKTIAILGSTSPDKIKPYGNNGYFVGPNIDCKYCWKKKCKLMKEKDGYTPCIESISTDDVMKKVEQVMAF